METRTGPHPSLGAPLVWIWAIVISFWLLVFNQQRLEWSVNPVYSYGFAVPFLAGYLLWERWKHRPHISITGSKLVFFAIFATGLLLYLPFRIIQEANPDWVKINWAIATIAVVLTLLPFYLIGGLRYTLHFIYPVAFCYTALPWPVWMEDYLVQSLMKLNADACAELMTMFGVPALAKGNLIQIANTWVNVEEACSGIRSLQTAFMMSLFLGEFHRLRLIPRVLLILSSFGVAFIINLGRTLVLTHFSTQGTAEQWHDTVGNVAMIACLLILWLLSELFVRLSKRDVLIPNADHQIVVPSWTKKLAICGMIWLTTAEFMNVAWYTYHESGPVETVEWSPKWPTSAEGFKTIQFGERTKALLKYNNAESVQWTTEDGFLWQMYYIRWEPGRVSKFLSTAHYPTVCLPASGLSLISEMGGYDVVAGPLRFPFSTYLFDENGQDVYVFHAILEDATPDSSDRPKYYQVSGSERIGSVLKGQRNLGQRVVGISIRGPSTPSEARASVSRILPDLIQLQKALNLP